MNINIALKFIKKYSFEKKQKTKKIDKKATEGKRCFVVFFFIYLCLDYILLKRKAVANLHRINP